MTCRPFREDRAAFSGNSLLKKHHMKTYEELKAMTTEDLVSYAMELQDKAESIKKENEQVTGWWSESNNKLNVLKIAIRNISELV